MSIQPIDRNLGVVLGMCKHWWQAKDIPEAMEKDCPHCGRPPGIFIDCWDEAWPETARPATYGFM